MHACVYSHVCSLPCTPGWLRLEFSLISFSPPVVQRTSLYSELSSGPVPREQLGAALGARDRDGDRLSRPTPLYPAVPDTADTAVPTAPEWLPTVYQCAQATQAFLPRRAQPGFPILSPCPFSDPMVLDPRHKDFFSSYFCDFLFPQPILRSGILREGVRPNKQFSEHPGNAAAALSLNSLVSCAVYAGSSSSIAASLLVLLLCSSSGPAGRMLVTVCSRASICSSVSRSSLSSTISWISTAVIGL